MRVGQGFDVHAFAADRPLILGGIHIPHDLGLAGHSDADVLIHAIIDALLGAAGLGDIGEHFPDNDPRYAGADSGVLLQHVMGLLLQRGYQLVNLDACVLSQQPRLSPYKAAMRERLAQLLEAPLDAVNIKATTTEKLGFTGRGEGIAAQAVVMIDKENT